MQNRSVFHAVTPAVFLSSALAARLASIVQISTIRTGQPGLLHELFFSLGRFEVFARQNS
jgi:hypothetical protein